MHREGRCGFLVRQRLYHLPVSKVLGPEAWCRPVLVVRKFNGGAMGAEKLRHVQTALHDGPRQRREAEIAIAGIDVRVELEQDLDRRPRSKSGLGLARNSVQRQMSFGLMP